MKKPIIIYVVGHHFPILHSCTTVLAQHISDKQFERKESISLDVPLLDDYVEENKKDNVHPFSKFIGKIKL